jgi:hypothetical protein
MHTPSDDKDYEVAKGLIECLVVVALPSSPMEPLPFAVHHCSFAHLWPTSHQALCRFVVHDAEGPAAYFSRFLIPTAVEQEPSRELYAGCIPYTCHLSRAFEDKRILGAGRGNRLELRARQHCN